ncbi:sodium:proton antiporter NhaD [Neptunomonas sp. XY-337]|uniref:sodium:proton antiporter NhaD n=1 Tax=Neptunomonas sp. XY-337 TaxID=2561897 RepID=UPI0010AAC6BE|nr:sodium:proton antiporter NhaD [Neptunomonas sp. XY-337]
MYLASQQTLFWLKNGLFCLVLFGTASWAFGFTSGSPASPVDLTTSLYGYLAVGVFCVGYALVLGEEITQLRKSKPIIVAAGLIWLLVGLAYMAQGDHHTAGEALRHNILEYAELFFFLLAAMTFINTMEERQVFAALRNWLIQKQFSLRKIYWITGGLAFALSPIADNLSTALLMGAVVMAVGNGYTQFVTVGCINVVIAANAGGAFCPFGDITTLMVWQKGIVQFGDFFALFLPSLINWLVPAAIMSWGITAAPGSCDNSEHSVLKPGGLVTIGLFAATIALAVSSHSYLHLPPVLGMMTGLGVLKIYIFYLCRHESHPATKHPGSEVPTEGSYRGDHTDVIRRFDIFRVVERSSWDTLMFFYGVVMCVGGLSTLGYLTLLSEQLYGNLGVIWANILVGVLSSLVDNIPVMFAVLTMEPSMSTNAWLLVTLTAGVGGSLLSIGSAAGIALMGQAQGTYTFYSHLRWSWAIALGYAAGILTHLGINGV